MPISWGYGRVSTDDQSIGLESQRQALLQAGVDPRHIRVDEGVSGMVFDRPGLNDILASLQPGDTLIIFKMDRLGRSVRGVLNLVAEIRERGIDLRFLFEQIDTTTPHGKFFFTVMLALAEMERDMIAQRTRMALAEIKRTGIGKSGLPVKLGRQYSLTNEQGEEVRALFRAGIRPQELSKQFGVARSTIYNYLQNEHKIQQPIPIISSV